MSTFTRTSQKSSGGTGVVCSIGMLTFTVDLATVGRVNASQDSAFKNVCPDPRHDQPGRLKKRNVCPDGEDAAKAAVFEYLDNLPDDVADTAAIAAGVLDAMDAAGHHSDQDDLPGYLDSEIHQGRYETFDDETTPLIKATKDEIIAARTGGIEPATINFRVHEAWEVDVVTLPGRTTHRLRPALTKKRTVRSHDMEVYAALVELLSSAPHLALIGSMRLRDARATYRLGVWGGQLILSQVLLPSDLAERDVADTVVSDEALAKLRIIVESCKEDFDEDQLRWDAGTAVAELIERNRAIEAGEIEPPDEAERGPLEDDGGQVIDLTAMLTRMIEAAA